MIISKNAIKDKSIAIIGGGPGGLTLARLLQLKGANVKVYERDLSIEVRVQGANVDLHFDSGLKVMEAAGLLEDFKVNYMKGADRTQTFDKDAHLIFDDGSENIDKNFGNPNFRPEIDRGVLRNMLIKSLLPETVVWDSHLIHMADNNGSWELQFRNGTKAIADVIIGADGYRSKIRPYVTDVTELYSGASFIQGEIEYPKRDCPEIFMLVNQCNLIAMGAGKTLAVQPSGDGSRLTFYTASMYPEGWVQDSGIDFTSSEEVCSYLTQHYGDWNPIFHSLFKACNSFVPRPINYFPLDQQWSTKSNITLIGDAAHLMPPSGEGVNLAMLDALDVSESLTSDTFNNLESAIKNYENKMWNRAVICADEAMERIQDFASPSETSIQKFIQMMSPHID